MIILQKNFGILNLIKIHFRYFVPEIRLFEPPRLEANKETKLIFTLCNPADYPTSVTVVQADSEMDTATVRRTIQLAACNCIFHFFYF